VNVFTNLPEEEPKIQRAVIAYNPFLVILSIALHTIPPKRPPRKTKALQPLHRPHSDLSIPDFLLNRVDSLLREDSDNRVDSPLREDLGSRLHLSNSNKSMHPELRGLRD
jgi:hypothetical protein